MGYRKDNQEPHQTMVHYPYILRVNIAEDPPSHELLEKSVMALGVEGEAGKDSCKESEEEHEIRDASEYRVTCAFRRFFLYDEVEFDTPPKILPILFG